MEQTGASNAALLVGSSVRIIEPLSPQRKALLWARRKSELVTGCLELPDERKLSYHIDGDWAPDKPLQKPVILLLHGMLSCRLLWVAEEKPTNCIYVVPSRPGYADSSNPGEGYSYRKFASDIGALMDHLGIEVFSAIGHSSGGPNALAVAAVLGPSRVKVVACLGGDTEYANPSARTPVDPVSRDVLCCCQSVLGRWWIPCFVPLILRRCRCACWWLGGCASKCPRGLVHGLLTPEELDMWNEGHGENFFQLALTESTRLAVSPSEQRRGMGGMLNDFAAERSRRFDFEPASVRSKVLFWSGALDKACLKPTIFNHTVLFPASSLEVVPARGHMGVLAPDTLNRLVDAVLLEAAAASPAGSPAGAALGG